MSAMRPVILLTGSPGVGKSTIIKRIAELVAGGAAGFYTREVSRNQERVGFEIVTLDGARSTLAVTGADHSLSNHVPFGDFTINLDAMEQLAVPALQQAAAAGKIVVIDEIGPMQIFSRSFCQVIAHILDDDRIAVIGTIVERPYAFADAVKQHPRVTTIHVSVENRDSIASKIYSEIAGHDYEIP